MTIMLWGRRSSANVQKVLWALEEVGADYAVTELGGPFGGLDRADYRTLNPNGLVPTLVDAETVVWESHAILRYLAAEYASGLLWPTEPRLRAVADQWTDWAQTTFQPAWISAFRQVVRTPKAQHDAGAIAAALDRTLQAFGLLEARLSTVPYVAGADFTYADIANGVALYRWMTMEIDRPAMPGVEAWYARLQERPAFRAVVCVSYADLVGVLSF